MILAESQNNIAYLQQTYALSRYVKVFWDKIWIITDQNNQPIQETWTWVDVITATWSYKTFITNWLPEVNWTGTDIGFIWVSMWNNFAKNCLEVYRAWLSNWNWTYNINPFWTWIINVYCNMTNNWWWLTWFYGLNLANVWTFTWWSIPWNFDYWSFSWNLWSTNLKNFKFSKFMISLYDWSWALVKSYDYNITNQTWFNLTTNSNFVVDNILNPESDCEFRLIYKSWYWLQGWEVWINYFYNAAMDAACAVWVWYSTLGQYVQDQMQKIFLKIYFI